MVQPSHVKNVGLHQDWLCHPKSIELYASTSMGKVSLKPLGLLAVGSPGQALHLLLQRLGETVLGSQLPSLRHHGNGANVHGALGAISKRLAALGVLGWHLNLHLEDGVGEHRLRKPHLNGFAGQMAIGAHDLPSVLTRVGIVLLGKDRVRNSCLHGAGEQHGGRGTGQSLLGKGLDALHVLVSLLWGRSIHAVQLRAAGHQVVAVVGPRNNKEIVAL